MANKPNILLSISKKAHEIRLQNNLGFFIIFIVKNYFKPAILFWI